MKHPNNLFMMVYFFCIFLHYEFIWDVKIWTDNCNAYLTFDSSTEICDQYNN